MNRMPKFGSSILSDDRCTIVELELTPEEMQKCDSIQVAGRHELLESYVARTQEIREEAVAIQRAKAEEKTRNFNHFA